MHFGSYVQFEHTQKNIPKRYLDLPKPKPENS